jgi:hypothetical protein
MRIIKKSGLINKNVVPRQSRNATTFFSQQTTVCLSHSGNAKANQNNTGFPNLIPFLIETESSVSCAITVSHKRQYEKKIFSGKSVSVTHVLDDSRGNYLTFARPELEFIKKFMQGSGNYFSVSVKHNLGWFYHGTEKAYFSGLCMDDPIA